MWLKIRDGPTAKSPKVGQWCGSSLPPSYISSANTITVLFHSDFVFAGTGFTLHYETGRPMLYLFMAFSGLTLLKGLS